MVYKDKFVVVVKCGNKILREHNDAEGPLVHIPFGSDYSLLLKNLSSKKALVNVSVDGTDVLYGDSLVVDANSAVDLLGFLNGTQVQKAFRFIQKTTEVQDHRGDKSDDGIIRVEYAFEIPVVSKKTIIHDHHHHHHNVYHTYNPPVFGDVTYSSGGDGPAFAGGNNMMVGASLGSARCGSAEARSFTSQVASKSFGDATDCFTPKADEGITVAGEDVNQAFKYAHIGKTGESEVMIIRMKGTNDKGSTLKTPITTRSKVKCTSCGKRSPSNNRFCPGCGTSLTF